MIFGGCNQFVCGCPHTGAQKLMLVVLQELMKKGDPYGLSVTGKIAFAAIDT